MNLQEQISRIKTMMGSINERQLTFLRRKNIIKELIDSGIKTIIDDEDFCDYDFSSFLEETQWQVTDNLEKLGLPKDLDPTIIHDWIEDNFFEHINNEYRKYKTIMCNDDPYDSE